MNRPEAERMLGGYATGTLTDAEKRALFAAALEHQELFEALFDEEALRELLEDPEARKQLLAVLPQQEPCKPLKLWRRPVFMGLAASLFALVTTSLLVWRSPLLRSLPATPSEIGTPAQQAILQDKSEPATSSPAPRQPESPLKAKAAGKAQLADRAESGVSKAAPVALEVFPRAEDKKERKDTEIVTALPKLAKAPELSRRAEPVGAMVAEARRAKNAEDSMQAGAGISETEASPFRSTLERLPGGQARLKVTWGPRGQLYVLKRTTTATTVVSPREAISGKPGMKTTLFELALGESDALDVYVLTETVVDPGSLSATGPIQGQRRRVYPE
jgi:hypothetical protein